ncbi:MAG: TonB-dependent receptor [Sphingobium sp.]|nr:TonB-dependent receptor [Sphingobium sp.]
MKSFRILLAVSAASVALAGGLATPAAAQQITTGIQGTVADESGKPIANATVVVTDTRTGAARTVTTGASGTFVATNLQPGGPYSVAVTANSFEGQTLDNVQTSLQGNTDLSFALTSGGGVIVVTGSRVKSTLVAVGPGQSFTAEILANAPSFSRDVRDVIRIDPRVSLDRDDGGSGVDRISCLGGNDRGNTFTVDGIPQNDIYGLNDTGFSSRSSTPLPYDAIRETQVVFAPFDVDYGQFTGCAINVVTKSGTNDYHFGGFYEYSDSGLRGSKVADKNVAPIKPDKHWGVSLSGPIIKDRLFLFAAYEHQDAGQSQDDGPVGAGYPNEQTGISAAQFTQITDILRNVYKIDSGPLVHNRDYTNDRYFVRGDFQINDNHRLEAIYQRLEEGTVKPDDLFTGNSPQAIGGNTFYISGTISDYYSGRLYSQWTDNLSTELRYAKSKIRDRQDPVGGGEAQTAHPIPRIIVGVDNPTGIDGAILVGPGNSRSANDLRTNVEQYRAVMKLVAGDHQLKAGFELNQAKLFNLFLQNATGTLVFRNVADLQAGLLSPGTGNNQTSTTPANVISGATEGAFGNFSSTGDVNDAAASFKRSIYSAYIQDEWRLSDSIKLIGGVRWDWLDGDAPSYNPVFANRYGVSNATGFSNVGGVIMPRVAATWDMPDFAIFSRAQLRGGVGIFSGGDPLVWFGNVFQNDGSLSALGTTQAAGCPAGQISVLSNGQFTGVPTCMRSAAIATAAASNGNTQSVDPNIKMPTVVRANVGFSTKLNFASEGFFSNWNLTLDYIYSETRNPYTLVDLAQAPNVSKGLSGYTIDGRPIYSTIDPIAAGCNAKLVKVGAPPVYSGLTAACFTGSRGGELMLTNSDGFRSHVASFLLSKDFKGGVFTSGGATYFSFGYAYTNSHDRRNMYNSTAGSNYGQTAAFDRQNPEASPGFYQSKHNLTLSTTFKEKFFGDYDTSLGFTFVARSGRPYSMTFTGNNVFNSTNGGLSTTDNALVYLPSSTSDANLSPSSNMAAVQQLIDFAKGRDCLKGQFGKSVSRNSCVNNWYFDMDLSFSQELPGPGNLFGRKDKIKVYAMVDNFLNLLNKDWNVQRRRNFFGVQDIANTSGVDAQGRYIITGYTGDSFTADNQINVSSSVWRLKFGISYDF